MEGWSHINQGDLRVAFFTQRACGVLKVSPAFWSHFLCKGNMEVRKKFILFRNWRVWGLNKMRRDCFNLESPEKKCEVVF